MSLYRSDYLGVYLVVDQWYEYDYNERECDNGHRHRRSSHGEDKFCSHCGAEIKLVKKSHKRRMSWSDAVELFDLDDDTFINVDQGDKPSIWLDNTESGIEEGGGTREITPEDIDDAVNQFHTEYEKELKVLDDNNVDYVMLFGLVIHYD